MALLARELQLGRADQAETWPVTMATKDTTMQPTGLIKLQVHIYTTCSFAVVVVKE
jgi:hypothetical protein